MENDFKGIEIYASYPGQNFDLSKQDFDITGELKIRKILEINTDYKFEFIRNEDKYGNDIKIFEYIVTGNEWDKKFLGFVEVEKGMSWKTIELPDFYYCVSFLKRKLFKFHYGTHPESDPDEFTKMPVENYDKTIYLKFNADYTNCFCQMKNFIIDNGKESYRNGLNKNISKRKDEYWELKKEDVVWGIKNCCDFIKDKFKII